MAVDRQRESSGSADAEIGKYLDILARDPNSRVFAPLAEAYRKAGLLDDAIETALEGLKIHPNYLGGRVALGRAYFDKRQYAEARAEMERVIQAAPDNLMAHKVLGHIAWEQNDLRGADKAFRMVLLLDPRDPEAKQFVDRMSGAAPPPAAPVSAPPAAPEPAPAEPPAFEAPEPPPPEPIPVEAPLEEPEIGEPEIELLTAEAPELLTPAPLPAPAVEPEPAPPEEPAGQLEEPEEEPEESPFEIFGRNKRGRPPLSEKGEQEAFRELSLEAPAATSETETGETGETAGSESPFEIFTRTPWRERGENKAGEERSEGGGFREIELEPTSVWEPSPPTAFGPAGAEGQVEEELSAIDLTRDVGFPFPEEEPTARPAVEPTAEPVREETRGRVPTPTGSPVFETETMASIYMSQGFYGRAADVYRRLLEARPGDTGLERKLEEAAALARSQSPPELHEGEAAPIVEEPPPPPEVVEAVPPPLEDFAAEEMFEAPAAPPPELLVTEPPAAVPAVAPAAPLAEPPAARRPEVPEAEAETIRQLRVLLESLRGIKPR